MKIGIDARSIEKRICGVSRSTYCLIEALSKIDHDNHYIIYTDTELSNDKFGKNFQFKATHCPRINPFYDFPFYHILKEDQLDLLHVTHSWFPQWLPNKIKAIVTIHDLFAVTDPDHFIKRKPFHKLFQRYIKYLTARSVKRADCIVTVSKYSKCEIENLFPQARGKIQVVYNSAGVKKIPQEPERKILKNQNVYFLYIGNCRSYKNVTVLIQGFAKFLETNPSSEVGLVIAGNDDCDTIKSMVEIKGLTERVEFILNPSDEEIVQLYQNSFAFVFPSKQEGFGIPVLEAMSFGVPTIISDADALIEITDNATLIFQRDDPEKLSKQMDLYFRNPYLKEEIAKKGVQQAQKFSWEASATKLNKVYLSL